MFTAGVVAVAIFIGEAIPVRRFVLFLPLVSAAPMRRQTNQWQFLFLLGIFVSQWAGCEKLTAPSMAQVSGTVELKGRPIASGLVAFCPVGGEGVQATTEIENGAYRTHDKEGLPAGKYKIVVAATNPVNEAVMMSGSYSTVETTKFEVDVTGSEANIEMNLVLED